MVITSPLSVHDLVSRIAKETQTKPQFESFPQHGSLTWKGEVHVETNVHGRIVKADTSSIPSHPDQILHLTAVIPDGFGFPTIIHFEIRPAVNAASA